jgi:hypothetical protein
MAKRNIHFKVGNGNCSVIQDENFVMIVDLNHGEEYESSYEMLQSFFRKQNGKDIIDVLCITHGDEDHCLNFGIFKEKIDAGELIIGSIWHQDFDRRINSKIKDLPKDYLALQNEIDRRKEVKNALFGDIQTPLKAKDTEVVAFSGLVKPFDLSLKVISPFKEDSGKEDYDHNDLSLVFKLELGGMDILFTADVSSRYWQDRIVPDLLDDLFYEGWAKSQMLVASHHGSYDFFGLDRESVRDSDEYPENYEVLNKIFPTNLILSATTRFPINGDSSCDEPPHYAAWKWYHIWFRENRNVDEKDKHPKQFLYTADGNICIEYVENSWTLNTSYEIDNDEMDKVLDEANKIKQDLVAGSLIIGNTLHSKPNKGYYGWND